MALDLPICTACGTQYDASVGGIPFNCKICDDPRQFVPPAGQRWTTLEALKREDRSNHFEKSLVNPKIWSIYTEPKFAIGQRAILIQTSHGNVLWDLITFLDHETINFIKNFGGLKAIVISHPHYYTTYVHWAETFSCPVYMSGCDGEWICRKAPDNKTIRFIDGPSTVILPGVTAITAGGHFPGSLVLHWEDHLFIADTIMTVPAAHTPHPRPSDQTYFSFQWSIPNMIPLDPDAILGIWKAIKPYNFHTTYGAFNGMTVRDKALKSKVLESMKTQIRCMGWKQQELLNEQV